VNHQLETQKQYCEIAKHQTGGAANSFACFHLNALDSSSLATEMLEHLFSILHSTIPETIA
jgi:hypothetical protein